MMHRGRIVARPACRAPSAGNILSMTPSRDAPDDGPVLDALARERLGRQLQALYEPVLDEGLDPRLAELLRQLDRDRQGEEG
ncbi:hypothetical protein MHIMP23_03025 [Methylobacterium hispanicum]|jgi:hypothetical protein|uniref:Anti-sigma factor NepR domain-containing protein n=2 Tax=Methylobacteriaceae TaxID=119045 RepID=A0AAV4ZME0_9HYPH|nr:hypothetical protein BHAOGJBA_3147 [Methylobacterium hispanicum]